MGAYGMRYGVRCGNAGGLEAEGAAPTASSPKTVPNLGKNCVKVCLIYVMCFFLTYTRKFEKKKKGSNRQKKSSRK